MGYGESSCVHFLRAICRLQLLALNGPFLPPLLPPHFHLPTSISTTSDLPFVNPNFSERLAIMIGTAIYRLVIGVFMGNAYRAAALEIDGSCKHRGWWEWREGVAGGGNLAPVWAGTRDLRPPPLGVALTSSLL